MSLGRATISDIARDAGVSTATVDRVLNNREGVHARTRDRVLRIAGQLGYLPGQLPGASIGPASQSGATEERVPTGARSGLARPEAVVAPRLDFLLPGGNNREGVHARTRDRVLRIAGQLGYLPGQLPGGSTGPSSQSGATEERVPSGPRSGPARREAVSPPRLDFLLPGGNNSFMGVLAAHLQVVARARKSEVDVRIHLIESFNPDALARALVEIKPHTQGIGVVALDHPTVREAIRDVASADVPIVTMVSDISNVSRIGYVGIDNRAAGRLAGHLLGRFIAPTRKQVALFAGSLSYRGHEEREMGFRHILAEEFTRLEIVELREVKDDTEKSYAEACALLERYEDLGGIYNIGAGNRGIARALEESGRARSVAFVGHELTEHSRRFLLSGTMDAVIDQNARVEARDAIDRLFAAATGAASPHLPSIRIQAIFRENIPEV